MNNQPKLHELNQQLIFDLGQKHPEIQHALQSWQRGFITWEQATYLMIWALAENKEEMTKDYLKALDYCNRPFVIPASNISDEVLAKIQPHKDH